VRLSFGHRPRLVWDDSRENREVIWVESARLIAPDRCVAKSFFGPDKTSPGRDVPPGQRNRHPEHTFCLDTAVAPANEPAHRRARTAIGPTDPPAGSTENVVRRLRGMRALPRR